MGRSSGKREGMTVDVVFGFLGSGKTTFITRVLREWGDREKIVVLVNEFGEVGIDGALLQGLGGNVVEMPSGCICCTLQADFRSQIMDIFRTIRPQRVVIEPTGVATIGQIRSILEAQLFEEAFETIRYVLVADATGFMGLYKANPRFVESQARGAHLILLNKCDRVDRKRAVLIRDALSALNTEATVLMTEFGAVDWGQYQAALTTTLDTGAWHAGRDLAPGPHPAEQEHGEGLFHIHEEQDTLGYESFGLVYEGLTFDRQMLQDLFEQLNASKMGEVVRAKGIFLVNGKWILMELASGEFSSQPVKQAENSRVSVIGRSLKRKEIGAAFERCITSGTES
jgi:G3E family GTPase